MRNVIVLVLIILTSCMAFGQGPTLRWELKVGIVAAMPPPEAFEWEGAENTKYTQVGRIGPGLNMAVLWPLGTDSLSMGFSLGLERQYSYELTFEDSGYGGPIDYHTRNAKYNAIPLRLILQRNFDSGLYLEVGASFMWIMCKGSHVITGGLSRNYDITDGWLGCADIAYGGFGTVGYKYENGFYFGINTELMNQNVDYDILRQKSIWESFFRASVIVGVEF